MWSESGLLPNPNIIEHVHKGSGEQSGAISNTGLTLFHSEIKYLLYTSDLVLLSPTEQGLQQNLVLLSPTEQGDI